MVRLSHYLGAGGGMIPGLVGIGTSSLIVEAWH